MSLSVPWVPVLGMTQLCEVMNDEEHTAQGRKNCPTDRHSGQFPTARGGSLGPYNGCESCDVSVLALFARPLAVFPLNMECLRGILT